MIKSLLIPISMVGLTVLLVSQVNALSLTNREVAEQRVKIVEGSEDPITLDLILSANQSLVGLCEEGCTIALENGIKLRFEGHEDVYIENGAFVIEIEE